MPFLVKTGGNESIQLEDAPFASGGEGVIHKIILPSKYKSHCVKIYKSCISAKTRNNKTSKERERKIAYMVQNPPHKLSDERWMLTWPKEIIYEQGGDFLGFMMPLAFKGSVELFELTNLKISPKLSSKWDKFDRTHGEGIMRRLMLIANIAIAVHHLHASSKYVVVDMKPQNILVSHKGKVAILDIDTVQISSNGKVLYPSKAMTPEYLPPENRNLSKNQVIQVGWDRFILGIIFYEVLFGVHPFAGVVFMSPYDKYATLDDRISNGLFPFGSKSSCIQKINADGHLFLKKLPTAIQQLFLETFGKGLGRPDIRPSAESWAKTLSIEVKKAAPIIKSRQKKTVDKQRKKDWQSCDKDSIRSLKEFRKKYNNRGKYTRKAQQLINELQAKPSPPPPRPASVPRPVIGISHLRRKVFFSFIYAVLLIIIPNFIIYFPQLIKDGLEFELLLSSLISLSTPNIVHKIVAVVAIVFSIIAAKGYYNYNYSKCADSLRYAWLFRLITFVSAAYMIISRFF